MSLYHPVLSPSPVAKAFCYVVRSESPAASLYSNYYYPTRGEDGKKDGSSSFGGRRRSEYSTEDTEGPNRDIDQNDTHRHTCPVLPSDFFQLDDHDFVPPYYLSPPETVFLHTAEDNPLEYTLAEHQEAVAYVRLLLKLLQQVVTAHTDEEGRQTCTDLPLDTPPFRTQNEAFAFYYTPQQHNTQHKRLVVAHYVITKVYEIIGILLDYERKQHRRTKTKKTTTTTKTRGHNNRRDSGTSPTGRIGTISEIFVGTGNRDCIQAEEWNILVQILETRAVDDYTKRGAALIVAYIVKCECEYEPAASSSSSSRQQQQQQQQETLVSPFQSIKEEHKSTTVPSSLLLSEPWLNLHSNNNNNMHTTNNPRVVVEDTIRRVLSWLTERLQSSVGYDQATYASSLGVVTPCLSVLLSTCPTARTMFLSESGGGGIGYLVRHIKHLIRRMQQQQQRSRRITPTIPPTIANTPQQQFHGPTMNNTQHFRPIDDNRNLDRGGSYSTSSSSSALSSLPEHISAPTTAATSSPSSWLRSRRKSSVTGKTTGLSSRQTTSVPLATTMPSSSSMVDTSKTMIYEEQNESNNYGLDVVSSSMKNKTKVFEPFELDNMLPSSISSTSNKTNFNNRISSISISSSSSSINLVGEQISDLINTTITAVNDAATAVIDNSTDRRKNELPSSSVPSPSSSSVLPSSVSMSVSQQQLCYELIFTMWCLSLDCSSTSPDTSTSKEKNDNDNNMTTLMIRRSFLRDGAIPTLVLLLKTTAPREKVVRVALATLLSLVQSTTLPATMRDDDADTDSTAFVREMIGCGAIPVLYQMLQLRTWNDTDIQKDLHVLYTLLIEYTSNLTRWNTYMMEIGTGVLRWDNTNCGTAIHTTDFFRHNVKYMEGQNYDFYPLKCLLNILYRATTAATTPSSASSSTNYDNNNNQYHYIGLRDTNDRIASLSFSWDDADNTAMIEDDELCESVAVCLYDIGEFVMQYPGGNGRRIINNYIDNGRAKRTILRYISHPRREIQHQALVCASKLLLRRQSTTLFNENTASHASLKVGKR